MGIEARIAPDGAQPEREAATSPARGGHPDERGPRIRPDALAHDLERSLDRLGTDHLDAFVLHRDDEDVPVDEILEALDRHVQDGHTRAIGVSNWSVARIRAALAASSANGRARLAISSPQFSLAVPRTPPWGYSPRAANCASLIRAAAPRMRALAQRLYAHSIAISRVFIGSRPFPGTGRLSSRGIIRADREDGNSREGNRTRRRDV